MNKSSLFVHLLCRSMWNAGGLEKNWYSILGATPTDQLQELKQKYQRLVLMVRCSLLRFIAERLTATYVIGIVPFGGTGLTLPL